MNEKAPEFKKTENEVGKIVEVGNFFWGYMLVFIAFWIVMIFFLIPDKFDPKITVCVPVSLTLYTNVGTQVLDKNSKPISCSIPTK